MQEETLDQIKNVNSEEELKQSIFSMKKSGTNFRKILKINFQMNGTKIKLNIPKIKQIIDELEGNSSKLNRDPDKAFLFKYFNKGMKPVDVIIKYQYEPKYAESAYYEFLEMKNQVQIPFEVFDRLSMAALKIGDASSDYAVCRTLESAVESAQELKKYAFTCSVCGEDMHIDDKSIEVVNLYVASKWKHTACLD